MEETTRVFIKKIKFNTYIYTVLFIVVSIYYTTNQEISLAPSMLLIAAFAFYAVGRQVGLLVDIDSGTKINTRPRAPAWVRGVTYFVVLLMILSVIFSLQ